MTQISIADQIGEVEREIAIRERVYARWVKSGKISQDNAVKQLSRMRAVRDTLIRSSAILADREPGKLETGECWGPAKVRADERKKVLDAAADFLSNDEIYRLVARLQQTDRKEVTS